ncbi:MAG: choline dehydrogenase [Telmatospirillum sp.]|nr:choline dehydrogenase [Telmatospirillum sp.]
MAASNAYDFIVAGAGSAGCALARRLSDDPHVSVLLVEAGGRDWNPLLRVPMMTGLLLRNRFANWFYHTEPEPNLAGRRIFWPRGKVLGGSSAINGMVYTRGLPMDYDTWAQMGLPGWSFADVLPYFKRSEAYHGGASERHGAEGPLPVSRPGSANPLFDAFIEAGRQAGHPVSTDFNGPSPEGFGRYDFTTFAGRRWSSAQAFLHPVRGRANLTIVTRSHVDKVVFEKGRAVALDVRAEGGSQRYRAWREIALSLGTVGTPCALMRSGIGDPDALRAHGIDIVADSPDVGQNLQDHVLARVEHVCRQPVTLYSTLRGDRAIAALVQALLFGTGPAATFPLEVGAFARSHKALDAPDLQSHFLPGLSTAALRLPFFRGAKTRHDGHGFFANIYQLRPESRGTVSIRSADPLADPVIRPNYLSTDNDRRVLRAGVRLLREVFAQPAFDAFRGPELSPGPDVASDGELDAWLSANADTVFHPIGTARMGADARAVVDAELRVRGVEGLRVADASVMPRMPSSNTHAPTVMIAEKAADFLRGHMAAVG